MTFGKRPNVRNLRIFGCEALAYVEKGKRTKLDNKVERAIYLGMSPDHSDDTVKFLSMKTRKIIYRRNVYFNERSFPARKQKLSPSLTQDTGEDVIGLQFEDEDQWWTVTAHGTHEGHLVLYYTNNKTKEEENSSVKEVRDWYNRTQLNNATTHLIQDSNSIVPTRKGYINAIAEASFKAIQQYDVKLPTKKYSHLPASRRQATPSIPSGFKRS
jgi:hypothetical protein